VLVRGGSPAGGGTAGGACTAAGAVLPAAAFRCVCSACKTGGSAGIQGLGGAATRGRTWRRRAVQKASQRRSAGRVGRRASIPFQNESIDSTDCHGSGRSPGLHPVLGQLLGAEQRGVHQYLPQQEGAEMVRRKENETVEIN
jgi:hypothetical protein